LCGSEAGEPGSLALSGTLFGFSLALAGACLTAGIIGLDPRARLFNIERAIYQK
jgi:hypothetical protein